MLVTNANSETVELEMIVDPAKGDASVEEFMKLENPDFIKEKKEGI